MGTRWRGMLAPVDTPTGDGRRFKEFTFRDPPLSLKWQREDEMGHDASVVVGVTEAIKIATTAAAIDNGWISKEIADRAGLGPDTVGLWAVGEFLNDIDQAAMPRLAEDVAEAMLLAGKGVLGPSVDAGAVEFFGFVHPGTENLITEEDFIAAEEAGEPLEMEALFSSYEVAAATLVTIPAFSETSRPFEILTGDGDSATTGLVAAVIGATDLPVADRDTDWDGAAARGRVFDMCTDGDTVDVDCVSRAFLWRDPDADATTQGAYSLGFADVIDGELRIIPQGVAAAAGGRGVDAADIPAADKDQIKSRICTLYDRIRQEFDDWPDCPFADDEAAAAKAALVAAVTTAAPAPPAEWFDDPKLSEVTPLTVTDDGRVFGHAAAWGSCHLEFKGMCVTPPDSAAGYMPFNRFRQTDDGIQLPVAAGRITTGHGRVGTGCSCCRGKDDHACVQMSLSQVLTHYDRLRTLAYVRAGRDDHGIWVAGIAAPDLSEEDQAVLSRRKVSGDWREVGAGLELVEVLALAKEQPGFPLPTTVMRSGRQTALVAAGTVHPEPPAPRSAPSRQVNWEGLAKDVADLVVDQLRAQSRSAEKVIAAMGGVTGADGHTGAMVALAPSADDAARLAVDDGEPAEQLHLTLGYLGAADDLTEETRARIVEAATALATSRQADGAPPHVTGEAFAVDVFNPGDANDQETAIVLGIGGEELEPFRTTVLEKLAEVEYLDMPTQHAPWVAHLTLAYSDDLGLVEQLADRTGPVVFDRLRVAFAGEVVDIPLGDEAARDDTDAADTAAEEAAALAAELEETTAEVRGRHVAQLVGELEKVVV